MSQPAAAPASVAATQSSQPAQAPKAPDARAGGAPPTPAEIRKHKLQIDGAEVELPESEVIARAQRETGSAKRFQEAALIRKQAEDLIRFAKENPKEFFAKTGMNAREWAEKYLMEELQREQMTPEQRKAADNEAKLKQYEDEKKTNETKSRQEQIEKLKAEHLKNYDLMFVDALKKTGLPKTAYTIKRMAELQLTNVKLKLDLTADQLAKVVREDYMAEHKALFSAYEGDQLMDFLGPDLVKKLSKAQIAKLKAKMQPGAGSGPAKPRAEGTQPMSWRDYQKRNRGRA